MDYSDFMEAMELYSAGSGLVSNVLSIALAVLLIVARWFIYEKAGQEGWAAVVPFYSRYTLYKTSGKKKLFGWWLGCSIGIFVAYIVLIVSAVMLIGSTVGGMFTDTDAFMGGSAIVMIVSLIALLALAIATFVFNILQCIGLAKSFGQPGGYAVGLILLPHIFYCILAFGKNYVFCGNEDIAPMNMQAPYGQAPYSQAPQYGQTQPVFLNEYGQPVAPQQPVETPTTGETSVDGDNQ